MSSLHLSKFKMLYRTAIIALAVIIIIEFCFLIISYNLALGKWVFKVIRYIHHSKELTDNRISFRSKNTSYVQPNGEEISPPTKSNLLNSAMQPTSHYIDRNETDKHCRVETLSLKGRHNIMLEAPSIETLELIFVNLYPGGRFKPDDCRAKDKVAIIVPFRDREQHLRIFLHNLHTFLQRQKLDYGIYVVEQMGYKPFNRAMLMNIGYVEALKQYDYDCFIFHDVDLIPEDDRNLYNCPKVPRHMSVAVDKFKYKLLYEDLFGGVSAMTKNHMETVNGFSNSFWGWGAEDDDMSNRIKHHHLKITRYPPNISRYTMLKHKAAKPIHNLNNKLKMGRKMFAIDGLNSLKYERMDILFKKLYTWILVNI